MMGSHSCSTSEIAAKAVTLHNQMQDRTTRQAHFVDLFSFTGVDLQR